MTILKDDCLSDLRGNDQRHASAFACVSQLIAEITEFDQLEDVVPKALACLAPIVEISSLVIIETHNSQIKQYVWYHATTTDTLVDNALNLARDNYRTLVDASEDFISTSSRSYTCPKFIALESQGISKVAIENPRKLTLPLSVGQGSKFGILQVDSFRPIEDEDTAVTFIHLLATYLALGIDRIAYLQYQRKLLALQYSSNLKLGELEQQRVEAVAANSAKSSFLANMSHEIRTPLGIILGFTELLGKSEISLQERDIFQDSIRKNGQLLGKLIDDLLDLAKIEEGKIELEYKTFHLSELLDDIKTTFTAKAREKDLFFEVMCEPNVSDSLTTDPFRLKQILINIVNNAFKFTAHGGIRMHVMQDARGDLFQDSERVLRFEIRDTGVGISPEETLRLFQPFNQANKSTARHYGGTGLGLILSRRLANALGGDVVLKQSHPGFGSTFEVSITPRLLNSKEAENVLAHESPSHWTTLEGSRILIADDALDNLLLFSTVLRAHGALVDTANNGDEAVQKALKNPYDILLLDLQMPIKDGFTAAGELRRQGFDKPILALTAMAMAEERAKALEAGCTGHLSKPVNAELLVQTVAGLSHH